MKWSSYNHLYESPRHGRLLFNFLSGAYVDLNDSRLYERVISIKDNPSNAVHIDSELSASLIENGILCEDESANKNLTDYALLCHMFSPNEKNLVILPTLGCNLSCSYCYEGENVQNKKMSADVVEELKKYISRKYSNGPVAVHWYGGEPLLAFDIIEEISLYMQSHNIDYHASIVSNAVLLSRSIIEKLENLKITEIQITLDGWGETHDRKRKFRNGRGSFEVIFKNLQSLQDFISITNKQIHVDIRINIDKDNAEEYHIIVDNIRKLFPSFRVYPALLRQYSSCKSTLNCFANQKEYADFLMEQYEKYGLYALDIFPIPRKFVPCMATSPYTTVVGPDGELYLCLKDVGDRKECVGNIFTGRNNAAMVAMYGSGYLTFRNPQCVDCKMLSICGGGCPNVQYRKKMYGEEYDACVPLKYPEYTNRCLDIYYDYLQSVEI